MIAAEATAPPDGKTTVKREPDPADHSIEEGKSDSESKIEPSIELDEEGKLVYKGSLESNEYQLIEGANQTLLQGEAKDDFLGSYQTFTLVFIVGQLASFTSYALNNSKPQLSNLAILAIIGIAAGFIGLCFKAVAVVLQDHDAKDAPLGTDEEVSARSKRHRSYNISAESITIVCSAIVQVVSALILGTSSSPSN